MKVYKVYKVFKLNDIICLKLQITYFKDVIIMLDINFNQIIVLTYYSITENYLVW